VVEARPSGNSEAVVIRVTSAVWIRRSHRLMHSMNCSQRDHRATAPSTVPKISVEDSGLACLRRHASLVSRGLLDAVRVRCALLLVSPTPLVSRLVKVLPQLGVVDGDQQCNRDPRLGQLKRSSCSGKRQQGRLHKRVARDQTIRRIDDRNVSDARSAMITAGLGRRPNTGQFSPVAYSCKLGTCCSRGTSRTCRCVAPSFRDRTCRTAPPVPPPPRRR
jgi:hypothetical protein